MSHVPASLRIPTRLLLAVLLLASACSGSSEPPEPPLTLGPVATAPTGEDDRPNIIVILVDDMRTLDLEIGFGRSIDGWDSTIVGRFLEEGAVFDNFVNTTPLCCPSRVTVLTGRYSHNHSVYANGYLSSDGNGGWRRFWEQGYEDDTLGTWMQQAGYTTALVGKYLNGYPNDPGGFVPDDYVPAGWDEFYGSHIEASTFSFYDFLMTENGELVEYGPDDGAYLTDLERDLAVDFVARSAGDTPFFLYMAPYAPHAPSEAAPRHQGMHDGLEVEAPPNFNEEDLSDKPAHMVEGARPRVRFFGGGARRRLDMTLALDEMLEALLRQLEASGELDNTYIFFASDNGITVGEHQTGGKSVPYEEAIRVPMLVRGPGVVAGGALSHLVGNIDLAPTVLDLAGVAIPPWVDGESLVGPMTGDVAAEDWRDGILIEIRHPVDSPNQGSVVPRYFGVRTADYTYVEYETGELELYDLAADPYQLDSMHDSADPALIAELSRLIAGMSGCSGDGCRVGSRLELDDEASIQHRCFEAECEFTGAGAGSANGTVDSYSWDFGDGQTANGREVDHRYDRGGDYAVTLTVEYEDGTSVAATRYLSILIPPRVAFFTELTVEHRPDEGPTVVGRVGAVDGAIEPLENADVEARWTVNGVARDPKINETNEKGKVSFILDKFETGDDVELCLVSLSKRGLEYAPERDVVACAAVVIP